MHGTVSWFHQHDEFIPRGRGRLERPTEVGPASRLCGYNCGGYETSLSVHGGRQETCCALRM